MPNIIEITNISAPELDAYARLTEGQLRNRQHSEKGIFIAESHKVIAHALDAGCIPVSLLMEHRHLKGLGAALIQRCGDIPVYTGESRLLEQLTGYALTRGILCAMRRPPEVPAHILLENARRIAILEDIVDPTNVGAIFRSAAALGFDAVLLSPACCDPFNRRAVRVSMGSIFQIPWAHICTDRRDWPEAALQKLKAQGFKTAALALNDHSLSIDDPRLVAEERLAVLLGTEGDGLCTYTIEGCDYCVRIPMAHGVDSLNVAAASAIAFWQLHIPAQMTQKEVAL